MGRAGLVTFGCGSCAKSAVERRRGSRVDARTIFADPANRAAVRGRSGGAMQRPLIRRAGPALEAPAAAAEGGPSRVSSASRHRGTRAGLSLAIAILATTTALVGGVTLYLREELLDSPGVRGPRGRRRPPADRAARARSPDHRPADRAGFPGSDRGASAHLQRGQGGRRSKPFERVIRLAALHGHRLLFARSGGNAVFDIADAGKVVSSALQNISPKLAAALPKKTEAILLTLRKRSFASKTLRLSRNRPTARVRAAARRVRPVRVRARDGPRPPPGADPLRASGSA